MSLPADQQRRAFAKAKYVRITPRKMRLVADLIRGRGAREADGILRFTARGASEPIRKALKAAISNAVNNHNLLEDSLFVSEIRIDPGPMFKRLSPRARGQAHILQKKTSHLYIAVAERAGGALPEVARRSRRVAATRGRPPAGATGSEPEATGKVKAKAKAKATPEKPAKTAGQRKRVKGKEDSAAKAGRKRAPGKAGGAAKKTKPASKPRKGKEK